MLNLSLNRSRRRPHVVVPRQGGTGEVGQRERLAEPAGRSRPGRLRLCLDLLPGERVPHSAHVLTREALATWRLGGEQVAEDAQLLINSLLASTLGDVLPDGRLRVEMVYDHRRLRVVLTVHGITEEVGRIRPLRARRQHRDTLALLDNLAPGWCRKPFPGGEQVWFDLAVAAGPTA